jgi:hypothetical protein
MDDSRYEYYIRYFPLSWVNMTNISENDSILVIKYKRGKDNGFLYSDQD